MNHIIRADRVYAYIQLQDVFSGIDIAGQVDISLFEQGNARIINMYHTVLTDDEVSQNLSDGDAVAVGKTGLGIFQVERTFQCDAV